MKIKRLGIFKHDKYKLTLNDKHQPIVFNLLSMGFPLEFISEFYEKKYKLSPTEKLKIKDIIKRSFNRYSCDQDAFSKLRKVQNKAQSYFMVCNRMKAKKLRDGRKKS